VSRIIAIGDVHGHYSKLLDLMSKLELTGRDEVVFLGDYVDYGPQSPEVIDYLIDLRAYYRVSYILGNHDSYFLDYLEGGEADPQWLEYGGQATLEAYGGRAGVPTEHRAFLQLASAPVRIESLLGDREYWFSHGMLCPTKPIESRRNKWDALYARPASFGIRESGKVQFRWQRNQYLIFGHSVHPEPTFFGKQALCIDTGAKFTHGPLTAAILPKSSVGKFTFLQSNRLDVDIIDTVEEHAHD
jgi:serine/threonine protein phosphatase 1